MEWSWASVGVRQDTLRDQKVGASCSWRRAVCSCSGADRRVAMVHVGEMKKGRLRCTLLQGAT